MILTDAHLHVGQFYDIYTSPRQLLDLADTLNIQKLAVSSTTTCEENYQKVVDEIAELVNLAGERIVPVLWLTPLLIAKDLLPIYLESGIRWQCVKIHPQLHPYWTEEAENMDEVVEIAQQLQVPILIHTGEFASCHASIFEQMIKRFPKQIFILAHCRPLVETMQVLENSPNAYCDTAFTPIEHIVDLVNAGYGNRILWGSDLPIQSHFNPQINLVEYYQNRLQELQNRVKSDVFEHITHENFEKLFMVVIKKTT